MAAWRARNGSGEFIRETAGPCAGDRIGRKRARLKINLQNRQRGVRLHLGWLRVFAELALEECREHSADARISLEQIEPIEVTIVSDRVMARVHEKFLGVPGPTDVITFAHGEILISAPTARRHAVRFRASVEEEIALYTVHGLLHLNGFEDTSSPDAARMKRVQKRIWKTCLAQLPTLVTSSL